jgi:hypothetical protein
MTYFDAETLIHNPLPEPPLQHLSRDLQTALDNNELDGYDFKMKNSGTFLHRKSGGQNPA